MTGKAHGPRMVGRSLACCMLAFVVMVLPAVPAFAHASFVASTPNPGSGIPQAPGNIVVRFSEPLVLPASRIEVRDAAGATVTSGPTEPVIGDDRAMQRPLGLLAPGVYTVDWTTLSPLDGHTLHGSYRFAVGSAVSGDERVQDSPLSSEGALGLVGRFIALTGLAAWIGAVLLHRTSEPAGVPNWIRRRVLVVAPIGVALGTALSLTSTSVITGGGISTVTAVVTGGSSGMLRLAVVGLGVAGALLVRRAGHVLPLVIAVLAVIAEAASGHAGSSPNPVVTTLAFASHLTAAGVWVVCIVFSLLARQPTRVALRTFSPIAIGAGVLVAFTGTISAMLQLNTIAELSTTAYGRTLSVKITALLVMGTAGFLHRRHRANASERRLRRPLAVEAIAATAAIALATALVGFPNPPREAAAVGTAVDTQSRLAEFLEQPATTFAEATGPFVVGVTIAPTGNSQADVLVQVLGAQPGDAVRNPDLEATTSEQVSQAMLKPCGPDCWEGELDLPEGAAAANGEWEVSLTARSNRGPLRINETIPVQPRDGTEEFQRMLEAMENVPSATVHEELRESAESTSIDSTYEFQAPDAMRWEVTTGGSTRIALGDTGYLRKAPGEPWTEYDWSGGGFRWPQGFYDSFFKGAEATRVVGTDRIEGQTATVLTFVQPMYPAWYRVTIDQTSGRLLRLEMRAERHVMDQTFEEYGEPVQIAAPERYSS